MLVCAQAGQVYRFQHVSDRDSISINVLQTCHASMIEGDEGFQWILVLVQYGTCTEEVHCCICTYVGEGVNNVVYSAIVLVCARHNRFIHSRMW